MGERRAGRYYPVARVAHIERLASMAPADFLYTTTRRDWDEELASTEPGVERVGFLEVARRVGRGEYSVLEVPEPLALPLLPRLVVLGLLARFNNLIRPRSPITFVFYAIENLDQTEKLRSRIPLPTWLARKLISLGLRIVLSVSSRAAFGTEGALQTYEAQLGARGWQRARKSMAIELFTALAPADDHPSSRNSELVGFLGSFEDRKGILTLIEAWPRVLARIPAASLEIIGHGPLQMAVEAFATNHDSVRLRLDPPRYAIKAALRSWHVLVLLSKRTPTWREQIGLPILEGLSAGCEIVTTTETGIADLLISNGHRVIDPEASSDEVAETIAEALNCHRKPESIHAMLPEVDGRELADAWLMWPLLADEGARMAQAAPTRSLEE